MKHLLFVAMLSISFLANADNAKEWSEREKALLCKNYIGQMFHTPVSAINHYRTDESGKIYVKYIREIDNSEWRHVCDVKPDNMNWAGWLDHDQKWGRWRNEDRVNLDYDPANNSVHFKHPHYDAVTVNFD